MTDKEATVFCVDVSFATQIVGIHASVFIFF